MKKNHLDEQYVARRSVRDLPRTIASLSERLANLTRDQATAAANAADLITIGNCICSREEALGTLGNLLGSLPRHIHNTSRVPLGIYRGLRFGVVLHSQFPPDVYLEGAATRQTGVLREHQGPRAILNAVKRLASAYDTECARVDQDLAIAQAQLRDYQARLGKPFLHDAFLAELTTVRDKLKACLSGTNHEPGTYTRRHLIAIAQLPPEDQLEAMVTVKERGLTALDTEKWVKETALRQGSNTHHSGAPTGKKFRFKTAHAIVAIAFRRRDVRQEDLLAVLDEARQQIINAENLSV